MRFSLALLLLLAGGSALGCTDNSTPPTDTGNGGLDGAVDAAHADAGPRPDTGPAVDTGVVPDDTGVVPNDTGVVPDDTGVTPDDTGVTPTDSGPAPDTGVSPADTGVAPVDGGVDAAACSMVSCATGCCQGGTCQPGTADTACGRLGAACTDCTTSGRTCGTARMCM